MIDGPALAGEDVRVEKVERRRRRRALWKRRTFWIALSAIAVAAALTLWLIRVYETPVSS